MEKAFRALNNLLEKFHHAYWFYLMPASRKFIPISKYVGPVLAIAATAIFGALNIWWTTGDLEPKLKGKKRLGWKFMQREYGESSFSTVTRPLYMPLISLVLCFTFCWYMFKNLDTISSIANQGPLQVPYICNLVCIYIHGHYNFSTNVYMVHYSTIAKIVWRRFWITKV